MAKRIYFETVKAWAIKEKLPIGISIFALLFTYMLFLEAISITGFSGDMICDGTVDDPCLAFINFTAREDVFVYPVGYDPWGRDNLFETDRALESWRMYRSWGNGWREIKLNQTCTATWCGAPPNSPNNKYSFAFREGRAYQIKLVAYKKEPTDTIKWGFGPVDPAWYNTTNHRDFDAKNRKAIIKNALNETQAEIIAVTEQDLKVFRGPNRTVAMFTFVVPSALDGVIGETELYDILNLNRRFERDLFWEYETVVDTATAPVCRRVCRGPLNETGGEPCETLCGGREIVNVTGWKGVENLPAGTHTVRLVTDVQRGENVEFVPNFLGVRLPEYASWNETYEDGLVACYPMDDTSGDGEDWIYADNNITTFAGETSRGADALNGTGYHVNKTSGVYFESDSLSSMSSTSGTISAWVNLTEPLTLPNSAFTIWGFWDTDAANQSRMSLVLDQLSVIREINLSFTSGGTPQWMVASTNDYGDSFPRNNWTLVTVTHDGTNASIYVDGVALVNFQTLGSDKTKWLSDVIGTVDVFTFGNVRDNGATGTTISQIFNGTYDNVAIWNRSLSASEIKNSWNTGSGIDCRAFRSAPVDALLLEGVNGTIDVEVGTLINATANSSVSTETVCISITHPDYGDDVACDTGKVNVTFNISYFRKEHLNDSSTEKEMAWVQGGNQTIYLKAHQHDDVINFSLNVTGTESNNTHPEDVKIYINDTLSNDLGTVTSSQAWIDNLINGETAKNFTFSAGGTETDYFKILKAATVATAYMNFSAIDVGTQRFVMNISYSDSVWAGKEFAGQTFVSNHTFYMISFNYELQTGTGFNPQNGDPCWVYDAPDGTLLETGTIDVSPYVQIRFINCTLDHYVGINQSVSYFLGFRTNSTDGYSFIRGHAVTDSYPPGTYYSCTGPAATTCAPVANRDAYSSLNSVNFTTNPSLEVGDPDGTHEWNYTGNFTFPNNKTSNDMTSAINTELSTCTADEDGYCNVPVYITSETAGSLAAFGILINYSINPNPVYLDVDLITALLNSTVNYLDIPLKFSTSANGTLNVSDLRYDYAGGNATINVTAETTDSADSVYHPLNYYSSGWDFNFPQYVAYLEFIPPTPTSRNVTPYGQTPAIPIFNFTMQNYGNRSMNLSLYLNESEPNSCVNFTWSTDGAKHNGTALVSQTWTDLFSDQGHRNNSQLWVWADYNCTYLNWGSWFPDLYLRGCCVDCYCSEAIT